MTKQLDRGQGGLFSGEVPACQAQPRRKMIPKRERPRTTALWQGSHNAAIMSMTQPSGATMESNPAPGHKPRSFSAESPFTLIGIVIAALLGIIVGGLVAGYLL